jgi:hypothetical protein
VLAIGDETCENDHRTTECGRGDESNRTELLQPEQKTPVTKTKQSNCEMSGRADQSVSSRKEKDRTEYDTISKTKRLKLGKGTPISTPRQV